MGSGLRRARRRTLAGVSLLRVSQEYVAGGGPAGLRTIGDLAVGSMDFVGRDPGGARLRRTR